MKAIITGYKGFIGRNLMAKLKEMGWELFPIEKDTDYKSCDIERFVKMCDVIFHVGAISDTTLQDANEMLYWNYTTSKILFDFARKYDKKVVYSSSAANYGDGDGIPNNIYGWSKLLAEQYGLKACEKFVALRYFNVYGPGEEEKGKMASIAYQAWEHTKYERYNAVGPFLLFPGKISRDFVYIDDIVHANIHAATLERGVFDVGTGISETFQNLVSGMGIPFEYHSKSIIPSWYQYHTQANKNKFMPGWKPVYKVHQGTEVYKNYLLNNFQDS